MPKNAACGLGRKLSPGVRNLLGRHAEPALAALEELDCRIEIGIAVVGPERVGEIELAVGGLPHQEIADALLAAGPDEEVDVEGLGEVGGKARLVKVRGIELA